MTVSESTNYSRLVHDLDLSIAIRKGIRQCIQHPIVVFYLLKNFLQSMQPSSQIFDSFAIFKSFMKHCMIQIRLCCERGDESIE